MNTPILIAFAASLVLLSYTSARSVDGLDSELKRAFDEVFSQNLKRAFDETTSALDGSKRSGDLQRRGFWKNLWNGIKTVWNENKGAIIDSAIGYVKTLKKEEQLPAETEGDDGNNDEGDEEDQDDEESEKEFIEFLQIVNGQ
ncbi:uncharacterized protein LOC131927246 isoform X2 [Physella acuta]|nr:uncharacterized protein LOC131927246 isoform X2 [Physella acuta]